ncbi:MAG: right-handed parallel beta-helix repeat-containing protein, partial [Vicinamibacteria bacterium]
GASLFHHLHNNTIFNIKNTGSTGSAFGVNGAAGVMTVRNTAALDIISTLGPEMCFTGTLTQSNNVSSDPTASGPGSQINRTAYASYFQNTMTGSEDLHLLNDSSTLWGSFGADLDGDPNLPVTDDIDRGARDPSTPDIGADEFDASSCSPIFNYRSIGTQTGALANIGTISVSAGSTIVTFSVTLPTSIGRGDRIFLDAGGFNEQHFILTRDSGTQVTLQSPAAIGYSGVPYLINRAHNTLQAWETARQGDLVGQNRREVGVVYNDGPFSAGAIIDGSITDSCHFMTLTAALSHRHDGTASTGVRIDGGMTANVEILVLDDYTELEWLVVRGSTGSGVTVGASNVGLASLVLYSNSYGIRILGAGANGFTARNCVVHNSTNHGISGDGGDDSGTIENCTLYLNSGHGIDPASSNFTVTNTLSVRNGGLDIFNVPCGQQSYNMTNDSSACGTGSQTGVDWNTQFVNILSGPEDLHLAATSDAINMGTNLSTLFPNDVDDDTRVGSWDVGADEFSGLALTLLDHDAGQVGDRFTTVTPVTDVLFRFKLTRAGIVTVSNIRINFSNTSGVSDTDVTGELWRDVDGDGAGDVLILGGVTGLGGQLAFNGLGEIPSDTGTNYVVRATVSNLIGGDTTTFSLGPADIAELEGGVAENGAVNDAVHTQDLGGFYVLSDHDLGQVLDLFTITPSVTTTLFRFKTERTGAATISEIRVNFTTGGGVFPADVSGALWADNDADGFGDFMLEGPVPAGSGTISFINNFVPSAIQNFVVVVTVNNLVGGDTTTFSLNAADIDVLEGGASVSGSTTSAVHTQDGGAGGDVFYSIGTDSTNLMTGSPMISIGGGIANLTVAQTRNIGVGDEIVYSGGTRAYIKAVISASQFVVHDPTGGVPPDVGSMTVTSIRRAFNDLQAAIINSGDANHLAMYDLTPSGADANLTWICYNDNNTPFDIAGSTGIINTYLTDPAHRIKLTAADGPQVVSGVSQRHTGIAGTGARFRATASDGPMLVVSDDYVTVEWIELDGNRDALVDRRYGVRIEGFVTGITVRNLLVHDLESGAGASGIALWQSDEVRIYNNFIYDVVSSSPTAPGDAANGIVDEMGSATDIGIYNNTIFNIRHSQLTSSANAYGIAVKDLSDRFIENNIVLVVQVAGGGNAQAYCAYTGPFDGTELCHTSATPPTAAILQYNTSSDDTATGPGSIINQGSGELINTADGSEDLHLIPGADAVDAGTDLSGFFNDDIDGELRVGAWDMGADEGLSAAGVNHRSIGTFTGNLHPIGMASVPLGSTTVTFTAPLPPQTAVGAVGTGDVLVIGSETLYIKTFDSATQVTLQSPATVDHSVPTSSFSISRAFNSLQSWENARNGDLVSENRMEIGVAYKDGAFTETLTIDGGTTDASHFMVLTVAWGQRHNGTASTGVVLDGQAADRMGIAVMDDYSLIEWFDLRNHRGPSGFPSMRVDGATNALIQNVLVHDFFDASSNVEGIGMQSGRVNGLTVRNSIIYNGDFAGIEGDDADDTLIIENCTIYGMDGSGIDEKSGTPITVTNTLSMGNLFGLDFNVPSGTQSHNMSEDGTASCGTCLPSQDPNIQFVSIPGSDFHLAPTATALAAASDLSGSFWSDIDGALRASPWDIGADELEAATAVELVSFEARAGDAAVELTWETGSEVDNVGFYLYRGLSADGPFELVNESVIPGLGSSP